MILKEYVNAAIKSSFCLACTQEWRRWTLPTRAGEEGNTAPACGCQSKQSLEPTVPHQCCLWRTNSGLPTYFPHVKQQTCPSLPYVKPTALMSMWHQHLRAQTMNNLPGVQLLMTIYPRRKSKATFPLPLSFLCISHLHSAKLLGKRSLTD